MKRTALMINLGSPDAPDKKAVKTYLDEFLMDPCVIDLPYWKRALLVKGIILNTRPEKSAQAYQSIWWEEGSPLIVLSQRLLKKVRQHTAVPTYLAMRYGNPGIEAKVLEVLEAHPGLEELYVIPMYPHFAMSSYDTVVRKVKAVADQHCPGVKLVFKSPWYNHPEYIDVLAKSINEHCPEDHHLLLSYHGIPVRHLQKSDPLGGHSTQSATCCTDTPASRATCYDYQVRETTQALVAALNRDPATVHLSFQSRLGRDPWLEPFTATVLEELPARGITNLTVACPAFVTDCLETLEEINMEGQEAYKAAGGHSFVAVPCLNDRDDWAQVLGGWITDSRV